MQALFQRLRAALTPQALVMLALLLLLAGGILTGGADSSASLERRIERTLSTVQGAGRVRVVVRTQTAVAGSAVPAAKQQSRVLGAVAVASGADDPIVRLELQEALCALLGLPPSAVNVMAGGE